MQKINSLIQRKNFNPRPHEEGDNLNAKVQLFALDFNPRPHEEGDRTTGRRTQVDAYFNPRPHEEGDTQKQIAQKLDISISIHALMKRATHKKMASLL